MSNKVFVLPPTAEFTPDLGIIEITKNFAIIYGHRVEEFLFYLLSYSNNISTEFNSSSLKTGFTPAKVHLTNYGDLPARQTSVSRIPTLLEGQRKFLEHRTKLEIAENRIRELEARIIYLESKIV